MSNSTWDSEGGSVSFVDNSAGSGGAIYSFSSRMNFSGYYLFTTNRVMTDFNDASGGALFMSRSGLELHGKSKFEGNAADTGGVIYSTLSNLKFEGNVQFIRNSAQISGGGIYSEDGTFINLGEIEFISNSAAEDGGGMYLDRMRVNMDGKGKFTYNFAEISGGAVSIKGNDAVHFLGTTIFLWNSASYGGAIAIDGGKCTLSGNASFVENVGVNCGAIHIHGAELLLSGHNIFNNNMAHLNGYGGAICAMRTMLTFGGAQNFTNNSAMHGGGLAIANYDRKGLLYIKSNSISYFQGNRAGRHGAAILVEDPPSGYCIQPNGGMSWVSQRAEACFFQAKEEHCIVDLPLWTYTEMDYSSCVDQNPIPQVSLKFEGNSAEEGGNVLYGGTLDKYGVCFGNINVYSVW